MKQIIYAIGIASIVLYFSSDNWENQIHKGIDQLQHKVKQIKHQLSYDHPMYSRT